MADEIKLENAKKAYATICAALDARNWTYNKDEELYLVRFGVNGDDIPMQFVIFADVERQLIRLASPLPFKMSEAKRVEGAIAACVASYGMCDGSFDYDISDGSIVFRMTASYRDSVIGEGLIHYMVSCTCSTVDKYNDQFLAIDKGVMSIADFIQKDSQ